MAQPYRWCKCFDLFLLYAHLHLLRVLDDFGGVRIPCLCTPHLGMNIGELLRGYLELSLWIFRLLFSFVEMFKMISSFLQSFDPQYSLISSNYSLKGIVITFMEELLLYWISKFLFPLRQSMPMGEKFRGFKGIWVLCFCCICHSCACILARLSCKDALFFI